ncbi:MAG: DEAD/DEAH box helicase, partial [Deltaproteobacteria bacterium]
MITAYHAKYFAYELTKRCASDNLEKLSSTLSNAQVDLNPHQIEAALFAFRSPLSRGALLADEVGLGKTIEAGLVLSQKWAERRRKILLIVPANLRKQWNAELQEKFFIP